MKFGIREICDVVFKTTADNQRVGTKLFAKAGQPAFHIDTAKTSTLEQATTTVYAQGGRGNNRLIAWEGEKTMTFTVEDALISPQGLAVLTGAGLIKADAENIMHVHTTIDATVGEDGVAKVKLSQLQDETNLGAVTKFDICKETETPIYGTVLDGSGAGIDYIDGISVEGGTGSYVSKETVGVDRDHPASFTVGEDYKGKTVKLDFYLVMSQGVSEITIEPDDFGGYFYVEASTLYRREDTGLDMAAEIILPKIKVQSAMTFTMASSGDPSTFTFTMDAFPGYTKFDPTKKVMCVMQVIGTDNTSIEEGKSHTHSI